MESTLITQESHEFIRGSVKELVYQKMEEEASLDYSIRAINTQLDALQHNPEAATQCSLQDYFDLQRQQDKLISKHKSVHSELIGIRQVVHILMTLKNED